MTPDPAQSLGWVAEGTRLCTKEINDLSDADFTDPSELPGWTRKHVIAHLASNAEAIGRLVHWARTGEPTPMYPSPDARAASIAAGVSMPTAELKQWFAESAARLTASLAAMSPEAWQAEVTTAQGRQVPASETPWMRSREVMVHGVDLGTGVTFADLPEAFLVALQHDINRKRGSDGGTTVRGSVADVTAYLAGRSHSGVTTVGGGAVPALGPWL